MRALLLLAVALVGAACDGATCSLKHADVSTYESAMHVVYADSLHALRGAGWRCDPRLTQESGGGFWTAYNCSRCD